MIAHARRRLPGGAMLLAAAAVVLPLVWVLRIAVTAPSDYVGDPGGWGGSVTLRNFADAWSYGKLGGAILNSLAIVPLGAVLATAVGTLAGYGLAKQPFAGRRLVWVIVAGAISMPLAALALPLFDQALRVGYVDSRPLLSLIYGGLFAPWTAIFFAAYFRGLPDELIESARIDGAGVWLAFVTIAVPLAVPAIVTALLLNCFLQWSELIVALVMLPTPSHQTVTVAIAQFSTQFRTAGPLSAAGMIIAAAPILLLFLAGQRWLRMDIFSGAVKQ